MAKTQFGLKEFLTFVVFLGGVVGVFSLLSPNLPPFPQYVPVLSAFFVLAGLMITGATTVVYMAAVMSPCDDSEKHNRSHVRLIVIGILLVVVPVLLNVVLFALLPN